MKIIIHIGPPKTGTSAIQKWLKDNAQFLLSKGIFYPEHRQDSNGISSGNFLSIFDASQNDYTLNKERLVNITLQAEKAKCHTLLLSSEFFFSRLSPLADALPDAQFIAYVRNPAQLHESHYNQSVKRHGNTAVINRAETLPMHILKRLGEYGVQLGNKLILRAYHDDLFVNNDIVCDFLSVLFPEQNIQPQVTSVGRINSSYTLEALEIKRWFNSYDLGRFGNALDRTLQAYDNGIKQFTFVGKHQFNDYKRQSIRWIERLSDQACFEQSDDLLTAIKNQEHQHFFKQEITKKQCMLVLNFIAEQNPGLLRGLALCVYAQPNVKNKSPFTESLFELVSPKEAMPNLAQYLKGCFHKRYGFRLVGSAQTKNEINTSFRECANYLLQARFSLVAYIKAFVASYK
ncbi:hypothetical protein V6248_17235 [Pseudoalteromonas agarivorans]|uniref:hypothetical protein n=1 Tax=Pseudoalteromonas agarivorans TaxID=176102 RepID=UPI00311FEA54